MTQINPTEVDTLASVWQRKISAQTWVNIFAHEVIYGGGAGLNDALTAPDGDISAGTLGTVAFLFDRYTVSQASRSA
jgi:hypothetical protein